MRKTMPIRCEEYDKIEIACMFNYPVTLCCDNYLDDNMKPNQAVRVSGIAKDTKRNALGEECIELILDKNADSKVLIVLTSIISMTVNIENPHFQLVTFIR